MGIIINPRGTGGAGKTALVRHILGLYGWAGGGRAEAIRREGRSKPIGYRLAHPGDGRPLVVVGHYERTSGGCDTIAAVDGGIDEACRIAGRWAATGHDVLLEGSTLSGEHHRSSLLALRHRLHVICLTTPPEQAAWNLIRRRRSGQDHWFGVAQMVAGQRRAVEAACLALRQRGVAVEDLGFDAAVARIRALLGLDTCPDRSAPAPHDAVDHELPRLIWAGNGQAGARAGRWAAFERHDD